MPMTEFYHVKDIRTVMSTASGALHFFESGRDFPFPIKRIYYITGVESGQKRGFHAHRDLQQYIFCPYGAVEVLLDNGQQTEKVMLDHPAKAIVITGCLWRELLWMKADSVICVAASDYYVEDDYIRDYNDFKKYAARGNKSDD